MPTPATAAASRSWYNFRASATQAETTEIMIYDEIGFFGVLAKDFIADLKQVPADNTIHLHVNSPGGDVIEGTAIYNALKRAPQNIVATIDGIAASMASVIIMAADEIRMPGNAYMFIHNPWTIALGDADEMRKTAADLDKMETNLLNIYASRAGTDIEALRTMMREETLLTAAEALEAGLIDGVDNPVEASAAVRHFAHPKLTAIFSAMSDQIQPPAESVEPPAEETPVESTPTPVEPPAEATPETPAEVPPGADPAPEAPAEPAEARSLMTRFAAFLRGDAAATPTADAAAELASVRAALAERDQTITALRAEIKASASRVTELEAASTTLQAVMASCGVDPEALPGAVDLEQIEAQAQPTRPGVTIKMQK